MAKFLEVSAYRNEIYKNNFPTGSWLGVKELAFPEFLIEIELESILTKTSFANMINNYLSRQKHNYNNNKSIKMKNHSIFNNYFFSNQLPKS